MRSKAILTATLAGITFLSACKKDEAYLVITAVFDSAKVQGYDCSELSAVQSQLGTPSTYLNFENESGQTLKIYWKNYSQELQLYTTLEDGDDHLQQTFVNHFWYITDESGNCVAMLASATGGSTDTVTFDLQ